MKNEFLLNIAVIIGGESVEHEISLISGLQTILNLDKKKYKVWHRNRFRSAAASGSPAQCRCGCAAGGKFLLHSKRSAGSDIHPFQHPGRRSGTGWRFFQRGRIPQDQGLHHLPGGRCKNRTGGLYERCGKPGSAGGQRGLRQHSL